MENRAPVAASADALRSLGMPVEDATNSVVVANPALAFLTDIFAMPSWLPFANVFSLGDVLIGVGIAVAIVAGMRRPTTAVPSRPDPEAA